MEVKLKSGESYKRRIDAVGGTVLNPMSRDEVIGKCRDLMDPFLGARQAAELVDAVFNIESLHNIGSMRRLLQRS